MAYNSYYAKNRERILQEAKLLREMYRKYRQEYNLYKDKLKSNSQYYITEKINLYEIKVNYDVSFE